MLLLLISFVAGALTVLAPCILPLLPVIVGGSLSDGSVNKKKAFTIVFALGTSVILFTLLLKVSTLFINVPEHAWSWISGGIILVLGFVTLFPSLWENQILARMSSRSNQLLGKGEQKKSFWGDVLMGAALGPVFSTCSPTYFIVIATVLPVSPLVGIIYLLSYVFGLGLALLLVVFIGQKIMDKLGIAADPRGIFKRVLGALFILVGLAIITGFDKQIEANLLNANIFDVTKVEQKLLEGNTVAKPMPDAEATTIVKTIADLNKPSVAMYLTPEQKSKIFKKAPELVSPDGFINTDGQPITLASLKGKVVLLDIWTYSCINCQRTLPYTDAWYEKYKDQGFEIIGIHTPEFSFEHVLSNVENAVRKLGIKYPVVLDNNYQTWNALGNQYWPRKYLVDMDGYIVYDHIGEGAYGETEVAIQKALEERAARMGSAENISTSIATPSNVTTVDTGKVKSPETYFGSARNIFLANGESGVAGTQSFVLPTQIAPNKLYLDGTWDVTPEFAESGDSAGVVFNYEAKNVYMAAGSPKGAELEIYQDGIFVKSLSIKDEQLYTVISGANYGKHLLRIKVIKGQLQAFTFTFG